MIQYYRGIKQKKNKIVFISYHPMEGVNLSDGYARENHLGKWKKAKENVLLYLKSLLALASDPIMVTKSDYLDACKSENIILPSQDVTKALTVFEHYQILKDAVKELNTHLRYLQNKNISLNIEIKKLKEKKTPNWVVIKEVEKNRLPLPISSDSCQNNDYSKLEIKLHLTETTLKEVSKEKNILETKYSDTLKKLETTQKIIRSLNGQRMNQHDYPVIQPEHDVDKSLKASDKLDGSSGLYQQRENGRYGSYSSFDNYDDEYNEKFDK